MVTDGYIELDFGANLLVRNLRVLHYNQYASRIPGTRMRLIRADGTTSFTYLFQLPFYDYAFNLRRRVVNFPDNGQRVKGLRLTRTAGTVPLAIAALEVYSYQNQRFVNSTNGGTIQSGLASYLNDGNDNSSVLSTGTTGAYLFVTLVNEEMVSRVWVRFVSGYATSPPGTLLEVTNAAGSTVVTKSDFVNGIYEYHISLVR